MLTRWAVRCAFAIPKLSRGAGRLGRDRRGVLLVEYALIAAVTGMVAVVAIVSLGAAATTPLHRVETALQAALHGGHGGPICNPPGTPGR